MGKKNDVPLKEKYRLWWEYLQRGENFKEVKVKFNNQDPKKRRKAYKLIKRSNLHSYLFFRDLFYLFGSFDDFWNTLNSDYFSKPNVEDITDQINSFGTFFRDLQRGKADKYFKDFPKDKMGPTSVFDIGHIFLEGLYGDVVINIRGLGFCEADILEKSIREIIRKRKSEITEMKITEGIRYREVKQYLVVYDRIKSLKEKKLSWEKITRELYPGVAKRLEEKGLTPKGFERIMTRLSSHERRLKMEYAKTKRIIKNAEKGIFPGKY